MIKRNNKGQFIKGNRCRLGIKHTDESKKKIKETEENGYKNGRINAFYGRKHSGKSRQKIKEGVSESNIRHPELKKQRIETRKNNGKPWHSDKSRENISKALKGNPNNPWFIDGRSRENNPYPEDWVEVLRDSIRKRDDYICKLCGIHQDEIEGRYRKLDIHHIDYDKKNLNPTNLISLCRDCHPKTNYNRDYWINYFKGAFGMK